MLTYIIRRVIAALPVLVGVSILTFSMMNLGPADPAAMIAGPEAAREDIERIRKEFGFDQPVHVQYLRYVGRVVQGDLGRSLLTRAPVVDEIFSVFPNTVELVAVSITLGALIAIPLGVLAAANRGSAFDRVSMGLSVLGVSFPIFFIALIITYVFGFKLQWFPISGRGGPLWTPEGLTHIFMPALALAGIEIGALARLTRSSMLEVLASDYITAARAKGFSEFRVLFKHALRNVLLPIVTLIGWQTGWLLGGAVVTETVFSWPGLGRLTVAAILNRDFPLVQGAVMLSATAYVFVNLVVDLLYAALNPRIRYE